ncbi:tRNA uridine-5-carboxymethylaminomethyl(34) synthesis enzyme MnmG [Candidatus Vidania fulgoroideorum]
MKFNVIIIGGGHAGVEAANICSKIKSRILLITQSIDNIGKISCSPSIGGIGKSQLVREIDILGGIMGCVADISCNNMKILNSSRGNAVKSTRIQVDKTLYHLNIKKKLLKKKNLLIFQSTVKKLIIEKNRIKGVVTSDGECIYCKSLIITTGTFMSCKTYKGEIIKTEGRDGEKSNDFSVFLKNYFPGIGNFKTGTPPRIDFRTINFKKLKKQKHSKNSSLNYFSLLNKKKIINNIDCWITKTNKKTKEYIKKNLNNSAFYSGKIKAKGPRYCPSIEDKIIRFPKNINHTIFLERESIYTNEIYPGGLSTSFDIKSQNKIIKTIKGLKKSIITRYGYSIKYDYFNPINLKINLESKYVKGVFFAGQINGTTGYEEAAGQGIYAGINSIKYIEKSDKFFLDKSLSYISIMVNDIIKKGVTEPYRMFTSRSENRLQIREDNVLDRLLDISYENKLIKKKKFLKLNNLKKSLKKIIFLTKIKKINKKSIFDIIKNSNFNIEYFYKKKILNKDKDFYEIKKYKGVKIINYVDSEIKYYNYIKKSFKEIKIIKSKKNMFIPKNIELTKIKGIPNEIIEKIKKKKIRKISDIEKIEGITPVCIYHIKNYLFKKFRL